MIHLMASADVHLIARLDRDGLPASKNIGMHRSILSAKEEHPLVMSDGRDRQIITDMQRMNFFSGSHIPHVARTVDQTNN